MAALLALLLTGRVGGRRAREPVQSALHLVVRSAVVGTDTHWVLRWSSQQAPHDASQSVDEEAEDVDPSGPDDEEEDEVDVQDALHPDWQRESQSVVQSSAGGLVEQLVEQLDSQLETQLASADAEHCESHCCSSCAAQAVSQLGGAHCVVQLFCVTSVHCAFASMSMFPHAETMLARATWGSATTAAKARAGSARRAQGFERVFMSSPGCNRRTRPSFRAPDGQTRGRARAIRGAFASRQRISWFGSCRIGSGVRPPRARSGRAGTVAARSCRGRGR